MKLVVAVSGGVDSVVLLHKLVQKKDQHNIVIAHFDHGIRDDSANDERFVAALAQQYGLPFVSKREELGITASEATARDRRYKFLHELTNKHCAKLVTAHHQNDLIETITINLIRGTGWRGLAVFGDERILRPLLHHTKEQLYDYALLNSLEWVEDKTNHDTVYLRNRLRANLSKLNRRERTELVSLWRQQKMARREIEREITRLPDSNDRHWFTMLPDSVAIELLRHKVAGQLTRPQLVALLHAIKTAQLGSEFQAGAGIVIRFSLREFIVQNTSKLL